jgi:hypothetical protein
VNVFVATTLEILKNPERSFRVRELFAILICIRLLNISLFEKLRVCLSACRILAEYIFSDDVMIGDI